MYDIDKAFKDSKLNQKEIDQIKKEIKMEFPHDEMLYELHVIRALNAFKKGFWKPKQSIKKSKE